MNPIRSLLNIFTSCLIILPATSIAVTGVNILPNSGFEEGTAGWFYTTPVNGNGNSVELVTDDVHSGSNAMKITASSELTDTQLYSDRISMPANALIQSSIWIKALSVDQCGTPDIEGCKSWYHLRVTVTPFDAENRVLDGNIHWDYVSTDGDICADDGTGTCGWEQALFTIQTPPGTKTIRLAIKFDNSTGTAWVDDTEIKILQELPAEDFSSQSTPIVIPPPKNMQKGNDSLTLNDISLIYADIDTGLSEDIYLLTEIYEFFNSTGTTITLNPANITSGSTRLVLVDSSHAEAESVRQTRFPANNWSELGNEGYFISVSKGTDFNTVVIGANSNKGYFYGIQTLKQLIDNNSLHVVDVWDYPEENRRGMAMGAQWFKEGANGATAIERLVERKANLIWNQGSYLTGKFSHDWRTPFTADNLTAMSEYFANTQKNFIDVYLGFGPRAQYSSTNGCNFIDYPTLMFSDPNEVDLLVNKMLTMYDIGFRNFGINYDDLSKCGEHVLINAEDIAQFNNNIGLAHLHFTNEVYTKLTAVHSDINFMMLPLWYGSASNFIGTVGANKSEYLITMRNLHADIELHSVQKFEEDVDAFTQLTQRPTMEWTNYFAPSKDATYIMPWISLFNWDPAKLSGFIFLPAAPNLATVNREDLALVSWNSALSYAWSPYRYDPVEVFQLSGARYEGAAAPLPSVSTPVISPVEGQYTSAQVITLSTTTPDTSIYYTLDGTPPDNTGNNPSSTLYTSPFTLENTSTLGVKAYRSGYIESTVSSGLFVLDKDNDGFDSSMDCNDNDADIYPGALEIKHDGTDQDCNGYDLTIDITQSTIRGSTLSVTATSALNGQAALELSVNGTLYPMNWNTKKLQWKSNIKKISGNPTTLTVIGVEGSVDEFIQ